MNLNTDNTKCKIIAVDFDGCLFTDEWPNIGEPIYPTINKLKSEQANGAKAILWTCRTGQALEDAVHACAAENIYFDAVNEPIVEPNTALYGSPRKIYADEYWDDRAVLMSEKPIGEFSDGYHTFDMLYEQRLILSAVLFNTHFEHAWKSRKHSDGEPCFDGEYFIVGIDTPDGPYTYHYKNCHWDLFNIVEVETAPEWDGHTDKDVCRLLSLLGGVEKTSLLCAPANTEWYMGIDVSLAEGTDMSIGFWHAGPDESVEEKMLKIEKTAVSGLEQAYVDTLPPK